MNTGIGFRVYLITDRRVCKVELTEALEMALSGGVKAVQLREKDMDVKSLLSLAQRVRTITKKHGARLFINDRVDVALAVEADGVHLGHQSMPVEAVRRVVGNDMLIGVSTHSLKEALNAQQAKADFVTFGPVFDTPSKRKYGPPQGIEKLAKVVRELEIPVFALGGIKEENIPEVLKTGVYGISMISAILGADDICEKTKKIVRLVS